MALKVKGRDADAHQQEMGRLCVGICKSRGGDFESQAGTVATAIQESTLRNINSGDRDSRGLFQQRPSMGWGTIAQITTPSYAIGKFLDQFLPARARGLGWLAASHKTQRSAYASAPAKWYGEGQAFARQFAGAGGDSSMGAIGAADGGETGTQPYEFSRGSADRKESTWEASGRLCQETGWRRFMRAGTLWVVSDEWLIKQPVAFRLGEFTPGVISLKFDYETRATAAEASLQVTTRRYSMLVGDVVELLDEGPGSGLWLAKEVRRNLYSQIADVALTRKQPKLPEPAQTSAGPQSAGGANGTSLLSTGAGSMGERAFAAAQAASAKSWPYSQANRNLVDSMRTADCSSGVSWVLLKAGIPLPAGGSWGKWAPVSGAYLGWGQSGTGQRMTVWTNAGHIWIQWHGFSAWRFDTGGGSGGRNWPTARSTGGFTARHWAGT